MLHIMLRPLSLFVFCAGFVSASLHSAVAAAEKLVVPFACEADPTGVYAVPSDLRSYPIIGKRDAAPFTACDPRDGDRCRTLMLHRFEIDCAGTRVSWPEFYAAISGVTTGRALFEDRRLLVRVRPQRSGRSNPRRFDRRDIPRSFVIEMPAGYAPVRGTVARFVGGDRATVAPRSAERKPPPRSNQNVIAQPARENTDADASNISLGARNTDRGSPVKVTKPTRDNAAPVTAPPPKPKVESKGKTASKPGMAVHSVPDAPKAIQQTSQKPAPSVVPKVINAKPSPARTAKNLKPKASDPPQRSGAQAGDDEKPDTSPQIAFGRNLDALARKSANNTDDAAAKRSLAEQSMAARPTPPQQDLSSRAVPSSISSQGAPSLYDTLAVLAAVVSLMLLLIFVRTHLRAQKTKAVAYDRTVARSHADALALAAASLDAVDAANAGMVPARKASTEKAQPNFNALTAVPKSQEPDTKPAHETEPQLPGLRGPAKSSAAETASLKIPDRPVPAPPEPKLPMPSTQPAFEFDMPDAESSALILPTTRHEALAALGVGANAGADVITRVVKSLKESCRINDAIDRYDKMHRQQRLSQIEAAWKILAPTHQINDAPDQQQTDRHA